MSTDSPHRERTLWLCTVLHGFTHIYNVALIPLYLLIRRELRLEDDSQTTLLVTAMGIAYCLPSYPMGVLADRMNRRTLLGAGLAFNGLAFVFLSMAHSYGAMMLWVIMAGIGGSIFHPCATALVARLFPEARGKALGRMGIGAGAGFFLGPLYAGWRASTAGWRAPVLELGLLGVVAAVVFFWLADDHPAPAADNSKPAGGKLFDTTTAGLLFLTGALILSLRDLAGSAMPSLGSLFLQHAHQFTPDETGFALSCIYLAATVSNPLFGRWSDRHRMARTAGVLGIAALCVMVFPWVSAKASCAIFAAYGFFFMATYPMVEAGLMESVHDSVRGRVYGLFIMLGGIVGNLGHWFAGKWVQHLDQKAMHVESYRGIYAMIGAMILLSIGGLICLAALKRKETKTITGVPPRGGATT
jgi:MFS family permease